HAFGTPQSGRPFRGGFRPGSRLAAAHRDAVRAGGICALVLHGQCSQGDVLAAVALRWVLDGRLLSFVEHAGAHFVGLGSARPSEGCRGPTDSRRSICQIPETLCRPRTKSGGTALAGGGGVSRAGSDIDRFHWAAAWHRDFPQGG